MLLPVVSVFLGFCDNGGKVVELFAEWTNLILCHRGLKCVE